MLLARWKGLPLFFAAAALAAWHVDCAPGIGGISIGRPRPGIEMLIFLDAAASFFGGPPPAGAPASTSSKATLGRMFDRGYEPSLPREWTTELE